MTACCGPLTSTVLILLEDQEHKASHSQCQIVDAFLLSVFRSSNQATPKGGFLTKNKQKGFPHFRPYKGCGTQKIKMRTELTNMNEMPLFVQHDVTVVPIFNLEQEQQKAVRSHAADEIVAGLQSWDIREAQKESQKVSRSY